MPGVHEGTFESVSLLRRIASPYVCLAAEVGTWRTSAVAQPRYVRPAVFCQPPCPNVGNRLHVSQRVYAAHFVHVRSRDHVSSRIKIK